MPNRALKMDESPYPLAGPEGGASPAQGAPPALEGGKGEALASEPLAGEDAMVRAFAQLRAAVRDAAQEQPPADRPAAAPAPDGPQRPGRSRTAAPSQPAGAGTDPADPVMEALQAGPVAAREDTLFTFRPGSGTAFMSGGAGWADVVRLEGVDGPPGPGGWNLQLDSGTATEVDGAILLSEDATGCLYLADGSELAFEGIERIEW